MEDEDSLPPAIAALGPTLFKLTEVYIGKDGSTEINEVSLFPVALNPLVDGRDLGCNNEPVLTNDFGLELENMELAKQMDALGLPASFHSTKKFMEKKTRKGKKKRSFVKTSPRVYDDEAFSLCSADDEEFFHGLEDNQVCGADLGDWRVYMDSYYERKYFYNIKTHTSTWDPPPGMDQQMVDHIMSQTDEPLAEVSVVCDFPSVTCGSDDDVMLSMPSHMQNIGSVIPEEIFEDGDMQKEAAISVTQETDMTFKLTLARVKKNSRKLRACKNSYDDQKELQSQESEEWSLDINKYWFQRYLLFSRFDEGIEMDEEGWFSVTPEAIAEHHAWQCLNHVVIDCFTGVGGNSIQFAQRCRHVIAIDIDPKKIGYAYHNASIYGVEDKIDFVIGDFFSLASTLKADTVFLSPPWGGPDYVKVTTYDLRTMLKPFDGYYLFKVAKQIAPRVIMFLPRNVDLNQLAELSLSCDPPWSVEVEKNYLNGRLKAITAYFSDPTLGGTMLYRRRTCCRQASLVPLQKTNPYNVKFRSL